MVSMDAYEWVSRNCRFAQSAAPFAPAGLAGRPTGSAPKMKFKTLLRGTKLFHGTSSEDAFDIPDGPAWFALEQEEADYWQENTGETGIPRTLHFEALRDLNLADVINEEDWIAACLKAGIRSPLDEGTDALDNAESVCGLGVDGWVSSDEVMLCDPESVLRRVGEGAYKRQEGELPYMPKSMQKHMLPKGTSPENLENIKKYYRLDAK